MQNKAAKLVNLWLIGGQGGETDRQTDTDGERENMNQDPFKDIPQ